jgi:replicative DNA helicase
MNTPLLERVPPSSNEAECAALGAMMNEREAIARALDILDVSDFYRGCNQTIFATIVELYERREPADIIVLSELLKVRGKLDEVGGMLYLRSLYTDGVASGIGYFAGIIKARSLQRSLIRAADEIMRDAYDGSIDIEDMVDQSQARIATIAERMSNIGLKQTVAPTDTVEAFARNVEAYAAEPDNAGGYPLPFKCLGDVLRNHGPGELVVLSAPTGSGKSCFLLQWATNAAFSKRHTLFYSLEMNEAAIGERQAIQWVQGDPREVTTVKYARMNPHGFRQAIDTAKGILNMARTLVIRTPVNNPTCTDIMRDARCYKAAAKRLDAVVIDYADLLTPNSGRRITGESERSDAIADDLKQMANTLGCPVIVAAQYRTDVDKRFPRRPHLQDIRYGKKLLHHAHTVLFLYRPGHYFEDDATWRENAHWGLPDEDVNSTELIIAKQRMWPKGSYKWLHFEPSRVCFFENAEAAKGWM